MKRQRRSSQRNRQDPSRNRSLRMESLEGRLMLAADLATFQNPFNASDVDNDEHITPRDALIVINLINIPEMRGDVVGGFIDVNDDDSISTHDALGVIDTLNNPETIPIHVADKFNKLVADGNRQADAARPEAGRRIRIYAGAENRQANRKDAG